MKIRELTVSQLTDYLGRLITGDPLMNAVTVVGELSSFKRYPSGHIYFNVVDSEAKLSCVMFRREAIGLTEAFAVGERVLVSGHISLYRKEGRYQLICHQLLKQGAGDLHRQFIQLKEKLSEAGLFDTAAKQSLPSVGRVGLITSAAGAALHDFCSVLARRNPLIAVAHYPASVQGEGAVDQLIAGIDYFNQQRAVDVIVITRGGGSLEDLWCFNDERLAQAIFASRLPVVAAIGHETDYSIAEFTADVRAATPSVAAEVVSQPLEQQRKMIDRLMRQASDILAMRVQQVKSELLQYPPMQLNQRLIEHLTDRKLACEALYASMYDAIMRRLDDSRRDADALYQALVLQQPSAILAKGYSYLRDEDGRVITRISTIHNGQALTVHMADGHIKTTVYEVNDESKDAN